MTASTALLKAIYAQLAKYRLPSLMLLLPTPHSVYAVQDQDQMKR